MRPIGRTGRHSGHRRRGRHHHRRDGHRSGDPPPLPQIQIDEPTIAMLFTINTSPFAGREGQYVTSRNLRERLDKELLTNVSIRGGRGRRPGRVQGDGPRRTAAGHPDRDDAPRRLRADGRQAGDPDQDRSTASCMEPMELLMVDVPGSVRRRGHREAGHAQGQDGQDGQPRLRPRAPGVPRFPRAG